MHGKIAQPGRIRVLLALAVLAAGLVACSGVEPFANTESHEIPPGPGLLSGEDGEFELYCR
ncbi:MAG: hypothetical protein OEN55_16400 [Alphaproteobacteria bacterium]|nr:hypothetical protein [Alphaproteobacteria bacterium]